MNAIDVTGNAPGGKRQRLSDVLPLKTPYLIHIFPIYACNFVCKYCLFSVDKSKRGFITDKNVMGLDMFKKCMDDLLEFEERIKVLRFVGMGEPLMHPNIVEMVEYASSRNIFNKIEILSNGSLLTPDMTDALSEVGLDRIAISIQGTTAQKYYDVCGYKINLDKFMDNMRCAYEKGSFKLHIKIIDYALNDEEDKKKFYEMFGDICDTIGVEYVGNIFDNSDKDKITGMKTKTQFGLESSDVKICPQPYFAMYLNPDGKVVPCYSMKYPSIVGNCNNQTMYEIWNGLPFKNFRKKMLDGIQTNNVCKKCEIIKHRIFPEDILNNDAERLKGHY